MARPVPAPPVDPRRKPAADAEMSEPARKRSGRAMMLVILVLPVALLVAQSTALFLVGLLPAIVAAIVDKDKEKYSAITVGAMNVAGVTYYALELWTVDHSWRMVASILVNPFSWLMMYGAAALGWVIYHIVPPLVADVLALRASLKIDSLRHSQQQLVAEWGVEISEPDKPDAAPAPRPARG